MSVVVLPLSSLMISTRAALRLRKRMLAAGSQGHLLDFPVWLEIRRQAGGGWLAEVGGAFGLTDQPPLSQEVFRCEQVRR